jgi:hypothetical protein
MSAPSFWAIFIQVGALLCIPLAALQAFNLWFLLARSQGRFWYRPLVGDRVLTTRAQRPGWYWYLVISKVVSLALSLAVVGLVGFWTFRPH